MTQDSHPANYSPVTLINVFEMAPEHVDTFIAQWCERAALMRTKPGFVDARLHRALSAEARFQLVNVAHWARREEYEAAMADTGFQAWIRAVTADPRMPISAHPALYEAAVAFSGPASDEPRAELRC